VVLGHGTGVGGIVWGVHDVCARVVVGKSEFGYGELDVSVSDFVIFSPRCLKLMGYRWVYLVFFNTLWVWFPLWVLYEAYNNINGAFAKAGEGAVSKGKKKR